MKRDTSPAPEAHLFPETAAHLASLLSYGTICQGTLLIALNNLAICERTLADTQDDNGEFERQMARWLVHQHGYSQDNECVQKLMQRANNLWLMLA